MKYKVLSLLQPWASLVVMGHKTIETRSWNTKYRGILLIHASAGDRELKAAKASAERLSQLSRAMAAVDMIQYTYPTGAIIGSVNLLGTVRFGTDGHPVEQRITMTGSDLESGMAVQGWPFTDQEKAFGDYSPGRYGYLLTDPVLFKEPIPAKGSLGIRDWEGVLPTTI